MTIFRFVEFLERFGHRQTIWIQNLGDNPGEVKARIQSWYRPVKGNVFVNFLPDDTRQMAGDVIIATDCWTVFPVISTANFKERFYFIQDYEPYFHPAGLCRSRVDAQRLTRPTTCPVFPLVALTACCDHLRNGELACTRGPERKIQSLDTPQFDPADRTARGRDQRFESLPPPFFVSHLLSPERPSRLAATRLNPGAVPPAFRPVLESSWVCPLLDLLDVGLEAADGLVRNGRGGLLQSPFPQ